MRTFRNTNHRAFYANHHNAASDVKVRLRDFSGVLDENHFLLLGSSGIYAEREESPALGGGTIVEFKSRAVCNVVALVLEDVFGPVALYASDSLAKVMSGSDRGTVVPRVPRYTSADESQKVFWNPGPGPVNLTVNWEEMGKGGFLAGVHPGNNVLTLDLGTFSPETDNFPLMFRIRPGRKFRVDAARVYTTSIPTGGSMTLEKSDITVVTSAAVPLDDLSSHSLTSVSLVGSAADRTVGADEWLDIVIASTSGIDGNLTVELDYTLF